jgi:hypothetical protein
MLRPRLVLMFATVLATLAPTSNADPPAPTGKADGEKKDASLFIIVAPERFHDEPQTYVQQKQKILGK